MAELDVNIITCMINVVLTFNISRNITLLSYEHVAYLAIRRSKEGECDVDVLTGREGGNFRNVRSVCSQMGLSSVTAR